MPKYPQVKVQLAGLDGNAFAIMGRAKKAIKAANLPDTVCDEYIAEATSGDYDNLLVTTMEWFDCDSADDEDDF